MKDMEVDPYKATAQSSFLKWKQVLPLTMAERVVRSQATGRVPAVSSSGIFPEPHNDFPHLIEEQENGSGAWTTGLCLELEHREL